MKKILLTTAAVAAISSSAFADSAMGDDSIYLRLDVLGSKFNKVSSYGMSHKSKSTIGLDVGAGYRVMDNMRLELIYNHAFDAKFKHSEANYSSKTKATVDAVMVRGLVDFADLGVAKLYAGAGLGWAGVGSKFTDNENISEKAKRKNNIAYSVHLGSGFAVAEGVMLDIGYSFRDYGKSKAFKDAGGKTTLRAHSVSGGVRFDI